MGWRAWKHFPSSGPCRSLSTRRSSFLAKAPRGVDWKHCRQNCPRNANVTLFSAGNVCWKSLTLSAKVGSTKPAVIFDTTIFQQRVLLATSDNFLLFELAHVLNLLGVLCHQPLPDKLWNCPPVGLFRSCLSCSIWSPWLHEEVQMVCDLSLTCNLLATFGNLFFKPSISLTLSNIDVGSASKRSRVDPFHP